MSLQSRLFAFFVAIVVLPLAIASVLSQRTIVREIRVRTEGSLTMAHQAAVALYEEKVAAARDRVQLITGDPEFQRLLVAGNFPEMKAHVLRRLTENEISIDYVVVADPQGKVLAEALTPADYLQGVPPPTPEEIVSPSGPRRLLVTRTIVPVQAGDPPETIARVIGGYYLDGSFVGRLQKTTGSGATVVIDGAAVASTLTDLTGARAARIPVPAKSDFLDLEVSGMTVRAVAVQLAGGVPLAEGALLISQPGDRATDLSEFVTRSMILLLVLALVGSALLGFLLARLIARPLRELAAGANAIAAGNYDQHIKVRSGDELGQLARAFNDMAERLSIHIADLRESREELKRALTRFGETLRATHDLKKMLHVVLETSMDTLRAQRGMLMLMTPARDALTPSVARGVDAEGIEIRMGEGVTGHVALSGSPVRLPGGEGAPAPSPKEPTVRTALSVPLFSQERVIGVLNLYDKQEDLNFSEADLGTVLSLADQAGVAIENVLLHQEAQRLSITDGLTGIWNYRYFRMRYEQEIDRSARFKRPFSLIVSDIDDFRVVNNTYGHQRGDTVLIELARRVKSVIRDIDVLARYGGEEFVLILPETDSEGALRTAERLRAVIAGAPFGEEDPINVTVSAGVACFPAHGEDGPALLRSADLAMYEAKGMGKNRVILFRPTMNGAA